MKITFYSNFLNHHQLPICQEFIKNKNIDFKFVATEKIPTERLQLGYEDMNNKYDFVIKAYEEEEKAIKLAKESDVIILGSAPTKYIKIRKKYNKLCFRYSERVFKDRILTFNFFKQYLSIIIKKTFLERNIYMLCASAFAASDYNSAGAYINRCFKWGYFPQVHQYNIDNLIKEKNHNTINILWVGRFVKYKHPEYVITLAKYLNKKKINNYQIKMIGIGPKFEIIKKLIKKEKLENKIILTGSMPNEKVIEYMKKTNIFIFTSNKGEGWGAVLNEAMNCGCGIVANKNIGSVPYLVTDNYNGYIYKKKKEFCKKVESLIIDKNKREELGKNAYYTMINTWNAKTAVNNLIDLCNKIKNNEDISNINYNDGPCSKDKRR